jgi:hypothetical protein
MNEKVDFKGYLKVETLDAQTREVLDVWEDPNLIMNTARVNISNLLAGFEAGKPISRLVIGDRGMKFAGTPSADILTPKTTTEMFVPERTSLFAEEQFVGTESFTTTGSSQNVNVTKGQIVKYAVASTTIGDGIINNYYRANEDISTDLNAEDFTVTSSWESLGLSNGFYYGVDFISANVDSNGDVIASDGSSKINISVDNTLNTYKTTYVFEIPQLVGNNTGSVIYTEAAMYSKNMGVDNIFSMRTFPAKIKDNSVVLKITWSIIF